jgi:hypothetical protein
MALAMPSCEIENGTSNWFSNLEKSIKCSKILLSTDNDGAGIKDGINITLF